MASNKRVNKAYVRYDGNGRVIAGSLILNRFKPQVGNWQEIPAYECCNPVSELPLRMLFSNILEVDAIVGDSSNVADWNTYFDLPTYGTSFTSVSVTGDEVKLFGGSNIIMKESLFDQADSLGTYLVEVDDVAGSIIELEYDALGYDNYDGCRNVTLVNLPAVTIAGDYAFNYCGDLASSSTYSLPSLVTAGTACFYGVNSLSSISLPLMTSIGNFGFGSCLQLTNISIPSCVNLGSTVGDNTVFGSISGNTIILTVPSALMTADAGSPDGDIVYLQSNNTVTIVTV